MKKEFEALITDDAPIGVVSLEAPLISNLTAWENISLITQYHRHSSQKEAETQSFFYLDRLGLKNISYKRNYALTEIERFSVMLLRALAASNTSILIDRPFNLLTDAKDSKVIFDILNKINDLFKKCLIFDFEWNREIYNL